MSLTRLYIRASTEPYAVLGGIFGFLALLSTVTALISHTPFWIFAAISLGCYMISVLWLRSFEVELDATGISCASILNKKRLAWEDIDRAEFRNGYLPKYEDDEPGHAFKAPFRLVLFPRPEFRQALYSDKY